MTGISDEEYPKLIDKSARTLDIGCATGFFIKDLPNAVGIDVDKNYLRQAKKLIGQRALYGDSSKIPFANNSFDIINLRYVVEHLEDVKSTFKEIARVSKPNSKVIIMTTNILNPLVLVKYVLFEKIAKVEKPFTTYHNANTLSKLDRIMKVFGFRRVRTLFWTDKKDISKQNSLALKMMDFALNCSRLIFHGIFNTTFLAIYIRNQKGKIHQEI